MTYPGLPKATPAFLAELEARNDRAWFEANRSRYEQDWLAAGLDLVAALAPGAGALDPPLLAVPKLNASLRRIHRDVRFSADKRPYEPWLHLILSTGPAFNKVPGFHFVVEPRGIGWGAGVYGFTAEELDRFRHRVTAPGERQSLLAAIARAEATGATLGPPDLARVPKGWDADPAWDHLLRRKGLVIRTREPVAVPDWLFSTAAPAHILGLARAHGPLLAWLLG